MINKLNEILQQKIGYRDALQSQIDKYNTNIKRIKDNIKIATESQLIIQTVAKQTQQQLEFQISSLVTLALQIFPEPYEFKLEFEIKRGKTEANMYFVRDGENLNPLDESGGGVVHVAAFALRIALWSLAGTKRTRNTIFLDEPFDGLRPNLYSKAEELLQELSNKLKLQLIVIPRTDTLTKAFDRIFEVTRHNKISSVVQVE